jgi:hypothetical protein
MNNSRSTLSHNMGFGVTGNSSAFKKASSSGQNSSNSINLHHSHSNHPQQMHPQLHQPQFGNMNYHSGNNSAGV